VPRTHISRSWSRADRCHRCAGNVGSRKCGPGSHRHGLRRRKRATADDCSAADAMAAGTRRECPSRGVGGGTGRPTRAGIVRLSVATKQPSTHDDCSRFLPSMTSPRLAGTSASLLTSLPEILAAALHELIEAELTATIGAAPGERTVRRRSASAPRCCGRYRVGPDRENPTTCYKRAAHTITMSGDHPRLRRSLLHLPSVASVGGSSRPLTEQASLTTPQRPRPNKERPLRSECDPSVRCHSLGGVAG
jgi:hypothetical protein